MAQVVRWYLCPLTLSNGRSIIAPSIVASVSGRWRAFFLPGRQWALVRVRGEAAQHLTLDAFPGVFAWPRGRTVRWSQAAPLLLQNRLAALGITLPGDPWPDEVLDLLGQFHQTNMGGYEAPWSRASLKEPEEDLLAAVEEV